MDGLTAYSFSCMNSIPSRMNAFNFPEYLFPWLTVTMPFVILGWTFFFP